MRDFFDKLDGMTRKRSTYTAEEIDAARKKAKKSGKTFMEELTAADPEKADDVYATAHRDMAELQRNIVDDFGLTPNAHPTSSQDLSTAKEKKAMEKGHSQQITSPVNNTQSASIDSFDGLESAVGAYVFGQDNLLKKLLVAFKRPWILPEAKNHARNTFLLCGPKGSGRHHVLKTMTKELYSRGLLVSGEIQTVNLSLYKASGKDNVFLQDLYAALQSQASVIVFENYEACHTSYLSYISDLVIKGECYLQDRYMQQQGQLINAANAFTKTSVSSFTAAGKYLVFISTGNVESLANTFGAPFINALGDICVSESLGEDSWEKIAKLEWEKLLDLAKTQFSFIVSAQEDSVIQAALSATKKNAGTQGLITYFDQIKKALATLKLEGNYDKDCPVRLTIEDGIMLAEIKEEKINLLDNLPQAYAGDLAAVKAELDNIVGLDKVKDYVLSLEEYYNTQRRRSEAGLKSSDVSKHMIFTGNPGTGKTTIARIISRYLKAIGVLTGGQLVEVSRADLVGRYVGHTAPLVNQVIKSALGGVLFIDEAYSLYHGREDNFGQEAIDALVKGIEDNRSNLIVILAGYSHEMESFLESNSGLKSRFPNIIDFPDYTAEELLKITKLTVKSKGYVLDEAAEADLLSYYNEVQEDRPDTAGNGRLVRNKVEEAVLNQSRRLVAEKDADLSLLIKEDFELTI